MLSLTQNLKKKGPTSLLTIKQVEVSLEVIFPKDYKEWMLVSNGCSGEIGENTFIQLWPISEIIKLNDLYQTSKFAPGLIFFGSDGGEEGFAFDYRTKPYSIIKIPFLDMGSDKLKKVCGKTFLEFLKYLESH